MTMRMLVAALLLCGTPLTAAEVAGTVLDAGGEPVGGARVWLLSRGEGGIGLPQTAVTDAEGRYRFADVDADEKHTVRVLADGAAPFTIEEAAVDTVAYVKLTAGVPVTGTVVDAESGRPVAGATVYVCDRPGGAFSTVTVCPVARTDDDGRFEVRHALPGKGLISAHGPDHGRVWLRDLDYPPAAESPVELSLPPGGSVHGRIVDIRERPVAGAIVRQEPGYQAGSKRHEMIPEAAISDADGHFRIEGVWAGQQQILLVRREEFAELRRFEDELAAGERRDLGRVFLAEGARLAFKPIDENDAPVEVSVTLTHKDPTSIQSGAAFRPEQLKHLDDGVRLARHIVPGTYTIEFEPPEGPSVVREEVVLTNAETAELGTITFTVGGVIEGTVTTEEGTPVAGAQVSARWPSSDPRFGHERATTGEDGHYRLTGLSEERPMFLQVTAEGFARTTRRNVRAGDDGDFVLLPPGKVVGRVVPSGGGTLENVTVKAEPDDLDRDFREERTFAKTEGRFELELSPGVYALTVRGPSTKPATVDGVAVVSGEVVDLGEIEVDAGLKIRGIVVAADDGVPVVGASVNATTGDVAAFGMMGRRGATTPATMTDADGRFEISGLEAGTIVVSATHGDYARSRTTTELADDGSVPEVELRMTGGGVLIGEVYAGQEPVSSVRVVTMPVMMTGNPLDAETGPDGRFRIDKLSPGPYRVSAMIGDMPRTKQVTIRDGEESFVRFDDESQIRVIGQVRRGGEPLAQAMIMLVPDETSFTSLITNTGGSDRADDDGTFEIGLEEPGRYKALVMSDRHAAPLPTITVDIPDSREVYRDLDFKLGGVRGIVLDASGGGVAGVDVIAGGEQAAEDIMGMMGAFANTDDEGRFRLDSLAPGRYTLSAMDEGRTGQAQVVVPDSGFIDVEIVLQDGEALTGSVAFPDGGPVAEAAVLAHRAGGGLTDMVGQAETDPSGRFEIKVPPGTQVELLVGVEGWPLKRVPAVRGENTIVLDTGGVLTIQVVDADGDPVSGIQLQIQPTGAIEGILGLRITAPTDVEGRARADRLTPGTVKISALGGPPLTERLIQVRNGEDKAVLLQMP